MHYQNVNKIPAMTIVEECEDFVFQRSNCFKASLQLMPIVFLSLFL